MMANIFCLTFILFFISRQGASAHTLDIHVPCTKIRMNKFIKMSKRKREEVREKKMKN